MKVSTKQRKDSLYVNQYRKTQRYMSQPLEIRLHAIKTYRCGFSVKFVFRRYKILKAPLLRWNHRFDGTIDPLRDRSYRPKCRIRMTIHQKKRLGIKWQLDVKYIPKTCYIGWKPDKFYQ